jgi:hypothetical protein
MYVTERDYGKTKEDYENFFKFYPPYSEKSKASLMYADNTEEYKNSITSISTKTNPAELKRQLQKELMTTKDPKRMAEIKESLKKL